MLRSLLTLRGYDVIVAANGPEGLALAANQRIDAVLADVEMPDMDGFELCARLRSERGPEAKELPVWLMTGMFRPGLTKRASTAGARLLLRKPFNVVEVCNHFQRAFDGTDAADATEQPAKA